MSDRGPIRSEQQKGSAHNTSAHLSMGVRELCFRKWRRGGGKRSQVAAAVIQAFPLHAYSYFFSLSFLHSSDPLKTSHVGVNALEVAPQTFLEQEWEVMGLLPGPPCLGEDHAPDSNL